MLAGTVAGVLIAARERLRAYGERGDAELLLAATLGQTRAWLLAHDDAAVDAGLHARYEALVARRAGGEPVAYLIGSAGFYGREFSVTPDVLVPRPETEHIVEAALAELQSRTVRSPEVRACDIGTGSGAIAITLACELASAQVVATDASVAALAVAHDNAQALGVLDRCVFRSGDLFAAARGDGPFDVVIANLPYIASAAVPAKPNPAGFEPRLALDGGPDGLVLYDRLLRQLHDASLSGDLRLPAVCFFEAAPGTIEPLAALTERTFPDAFVEIGEDYAGLERFVALTVHQEHSR